MTGRGLPASVEVRAVDWLAAAHPDPSSVRRLWLEDARAMLPVGVRWDAIKVPASILRQLAGDDPGQVRSLLTETGAAGPTVVDPGRSYYLLVPRGTAAAWRVHGTECLGVACYLSTPAPSCTTPPGAHWLTPPDGTGVLCDPAAVRELVAAALGPRDGAR